MISLKYDKNLCVIFVPDTTISGSPCKLIERLLDYMGSGLRNIHSPIKYWERVTNNRNILLTAGPATGGIPQINKSSLVVYM